MELLVIKSDIYEWKTLSKVDFVDAMGGRNYQGREKFIKEMQKVSMSFRPVSQAISLMIKSTSAQIIFLKQQLGEIDKMIVKITKDNGAVQTLSQHNGIGIQTASTIQAEIIDIRRFVKDDNLASYGGLARHQHNTGENEREVENHFFNPRLKNAFMTAARNYVTCNPESHLAGYYHNLVKGGMKKTDARKRVARALVRVMFRDLQALIKIEDLDIIEDIEKGDEKNMATGISRSDKDHSNISSSSPVKNNTICDEKIKREKQALNYHGKVMVATGKT